MVDFIISKKRNGEGGILRATIKKVGRKRKNLLTWRIYQVWSSLINPWNGLDWKGIPKLDQREEKILPSSLNLG